MIARLRAMDRTSFAILLLLAAMFGFAAMDAMSKQLAHEGYSIVQILWVRNVTFTLLALWMVRRRGMSVLAMAKTPRPGLQFGRALLLVVESATFVWAFSLLPLADVHAIAASSPLIVVALSVPLLGEKVGIRRWLAVAAGFCGVLLIVRPGFAEISLPILVPLLGAVQWALYQALSRVCARTDSAETTMLWTAVVGLVATSAPMPWSWTTPTPHGWALLLGVAVLGSLCHYALIKAFSLTEASALQPYSYTLAMWAAVLGFLAFGDVPDVWVLSGMAIIVASGLYAWHRERVRAREKR